MSESTEEWMERSAREDADFEQRAASLDPAVPVCDICGDTADDVRRCDTCSWNMGECCMANEDTCVECVDENGEDE